MVLIVDAVNTTITFDAVDMTTKQIVKRFKNDEEKLQADAFKMLNNRPKGVRELLLDAWCNVVANELCDNPEISAELINLWNTLVYEEDAFVGKEDVLTTQLKSILQKSIQ